MAETVKQEAQDKYLTAIGRLALGPPFVALTLSHASLYQSSVFVSPAPPLATDWQGVSTSPRVTETIPWGHPSPTTWASSWKSLHHGSQHDRPGIKSA